MIKRQKLQSMAALIGKGLSGLIKTDRKISTSNHSQNSRINVANIGFNLKGCADFREKVPKLKSEDVIGLYKTRAFTLSQQPFSDMELQLQDEKRGSEVLAVNNGGAACQRGSSTVFSDAGGSLPEKIVVAVDVDEVLGNFVSALNRFIADRYSSVHSVSEYYVYEFFKIWNCSRDEADIRVHEFFKTPYFKNGIYPLPGAQKTLNKLSSFCTLSVVTSRQNVIKDHTIEWLEKHYSGLFDEIHFGNHFALDGKSKPKSEICRSMGAKVLIDDNPRYALECAEVGIRVLLFDYQNTYPWCKTGSNNQHPLVTKVHDWEEVEQQLLSWVYSSHL
ncbi:uncharacterized protein LOC110715746 [Chenopodium quinoa]|uniref:uncharacterized protein LOC110715746 n=1 Tax=Chenopodium quinoa TaxID=63459 RepID=UPI000B79774F|nr:uncharacterized protein LOC110715746 [Chenopodium quinoa]